jgi:hypothetical protein
VNGKQAIDLHLFLQTRRKNMVKSRHRVMAGDIKQTARDGSD